MDTQPTPETAGAEDYPVPVHKLPGPTPRHTINTVRNADGTLIGWIHGESRYSGHQHYRYEMVMRSDMTTKLTTYTSPFSYGDLGAALLGLTRDHPDKIRIEEGDTARDPDRIPDTLIVRVAKDRVPGDDDIAETLHDLTDAPFTVAETAIARAMAHGLLTYDPTAGQLMVEAVPTDAGLALLEPRREETPR